MGEGGAPRAVKFGFGPLGCYVGFNPREGLLPLPETAGPEYGSLFHYQEAGRDSDFRE